MTRHRLLRALAVGVAVPIIWLSTSCLAPGRIEPGTTYTGDGTFYAQGSYGNCSYNENAGTMYAAMNDADYENARICGGFVQASGPRGTVVVKIVDRCPECLPGDIDFSPEAFAQIANPSAGRVAISWQLVSPASIGNIAYRVKDGANPWWLAIQPLYHRNLVQSLEVMVTGSWQMLERQPYNYFVLASGAGAGPFTVRLTDIWGEQTVSSGITLSPMAIQPSGSQFARH